MSDNKLIKYTQRELEKISNSITITNKLLSLNYSLPIFHLKRTQNTPQVVLMPEGYFSILGPSKPLNAAEFYKPIIDWINNYFLFIKKPIQFEFYLRDINADSTVLIASLIKNIFIKSQNNKIELSVKWFCKDKDDSSVIELGEYLKEILKENIKIEIYGDEF